MTANIEKSVSIFRPLRAALAAVVIAAVGYASFTVWKVKEVLIASENRLTASGMVSQLLTQHIQTRGTWPRSWADLTSLRVDGEAGFEWPRDVSKIQQMIWVDFETDVDAVAGSDAESAAWLVPQGPIPGIYKYYLELVITAAKEAVQGGH